MVLLVGLVCSYPKLGQTLQCFALFNGYKTVISIEKSRDFREEF